MILNVSSYNVRRHTFSNGSNITAITPKFPAPQFVFYLRVSFKQLYRCNALYYLHYPRRRVSRCRSDKDVYMVSVAPHLFKFKVISFTNASAYLSKCLNSVPLNQHLSSILDTHHHMIPNSIYAMGSPFQFHHDLPYCLWLLISSSHPQQAAGYLNKE